MRCKLRCSSVALVLSRIRNTCGVSEPSVGFGPKRSDGDRLGCFMPPPTRVLCEVEPLVIVAAQRGGGGGAGTGSVCDTLASCRRSFSSAGSTRMLFPNVATSSSADLGQVIIIAARTYLAFSLSRTVLGEQPPLTSRGRCDHVSSHATAPFNSRSSFRISSIKDYALSCFAFVYSDGPHPPSHPSSHDVLLVPT